ncbi:MAG: PAS-domain containing protein [Pseudolabrys sp.]
MVEELEQLNRGLERQVEARTAALSEREAELREQNVRFDTALNNMSHGLLMFDADARLVICNRRYLELYGLTPEVAKRGAPFGGLAGGARRQRDFVGDPAEYIATLRSKVARGEIPDRLVEQPDGRTIAIVTRPMAGGGWIATMKTSASAGARRSRSPTWRTTTR